MMVVTKTMICSILVNSPAWGQTIFVEDFDYPAGNNLTDHGWIAFQSSGINPITVSTSGLSYTGYQSSGVGNAALLDNDGEDLAKSFTAITSGDVYVSFMINASVLEQNVSFDFPVGISQTNGTGVWGRVHLDRNSAGDAIQFGLAQFTESPVNTPFNYSFNTTYLIVLKYTINAGASNDQASLFVLEDPNLPATEPSSPTLGPVSSGNTDPADIARVVIRQYHQNNNILVDGIRVGLSWSDGAPLPVELTSFTHHVDGNNVKLSWTTATETNNFGFEIQRKKEKTEWQKVGFMRGQGTTVQPTYYEFTDTDLPTGTYRYRLKQIDTDGSFEYSRILVVTVGGPLTTRLAQNYPNPFNPSTNIIYAVEEAGFVAVRIHDTLGRLVTTLVRQNQSAGEYSLVWDGKDDRGNQVAAGVYFYSLQVDGQTPYRKRMLLLK
jgi:hypothetical protein